MSNHAARINMIKQQLRTGNVLDERVLALYESIHRETFLPVKFQPFAYSDMHIPLAHGQLMMTPLEEALLLQSLQLKGHEVVLEVGTGSGFLTALLSRLCKKIISVDYFADFTASASQKLAEHNCDNTTLFTGDASQGWVDLAPYDIIVFSGALEELNEFQRLQVMAGGRLFAIIGKKPVMQGQLHVLDHDKQWQESVVFETCLPPLVDNLKHDAFVFQDKSTC